MYGFTAFAFGLRLYSDELIQVLVVTLNLKTGIRIQRGIKVKAVSQLSAFLGQRYRTDFATTVYSLTLYTHTGTQIIKRYIHEVPNWGHTCHVGRCRWRISVEGKGLTNNRECGIS